MSEQNFFLPLLAAASPIHPRVQLELQLQQQQHQGGLVQVSPSFRSPTSIRISSAAAVEVGGRRPPSAAAASVTATTAGSSTVVVAVAQRQARVVVLPLSLYPPHATVDGGF